MKRRKKMKIISISTFAAVLISSLASCGNNSDRSSESKSESTTTAYTSATSAQTTPDNSSVATTQISLSTTSQTKTTPKAVKPKLADIKFAYGLPVCSEINAIKINANMIESPDSNSPNFSSSDIDILSYFNNIKKIFFFKWGGKCMLPIVAQFSFLVA